jgi:hypothetical protein
MKPHVSIILLMGHPGHTAAGSENLEIQQRKLVTGVVAVRLTDASTLASGF